MEVCSLLVNLRKGMQSSSEQPLVGEEHCVTNLITAAKETNAYRYWRKICKLVSRNTLISHSALLCAKSFFVRFE